MLQNLRLRKIIFGLLLIIVLAALAFGALWVTNAFGWRAFRLVDAETFIGAQLPSGAGDVQFATEAEKGRIVWLRFTLPVDASLDSFLADMDITAPLTGDFTPFPNPNYKETGIPWWTPHAAQSYTGLYAITAGKVYEILVDTTASDTTDIIYLRVYAL
jgi:hypothetical protein